MFFFKLILDKLCNNSIEIIRTKETSSPVICSQDIKIENLTHLLKTQSFKSEFNITNDDSSFFLNSSQTSTDTKNSINKTKLSTFKTIVNSLNEDPNRSVERDTMAVNLHPPALNNQFNQFGSFSTQTTPNYFNNYTDNRQFNNSDQLNYRQTFTAGTTSVPFLNYSDIKLKQKRSYLPPPPLPPPQANYALTIVPQAFVPSYFSDINSSKMNSLEDYTLNANESSIRKEFQNDLFLKSQSTLTSFMYKNSNDQSNTLSSSSSSSSSSSNSSPSFQPPYIKYKKPPSYEESLRKIVSFILNNFH